MNGGKHRLVWFAVSSFLCCSVMNAQQAPPPGQSVIVPCLVTIGELLGRVSRSTTSPPLHQYRRLSGVRQKVGGQFVNL
jgi:hypothetical protein